MREAIENAMQKKMGRKEIRDEIVAHIKDRESRLLGLTTDDVQSLAYQKKTEWTWLHQFVRRNATNTSLARVQGFNKINIEVHFKSLEEVLTLNNFALENAYNMDESGFSTVQDTFENWMFAPAETTNRSLAKNQLSSTSLESDVDGPNIPNQIVNTNSKKMPAVDRPRTLKLSVSIAVRLPLPKVTEASTETRESRKKGKWAEIQAA
ncbi:hypothetical protein ILUMI_19515 [Ignelater luminosus]|uniref:Uncharacterized protein n=1 Tax=Ignelater luminosus TaxID=2038154 RepID=A0A8K0CG22_IGNLU|nr:hypothetical protein ILUMI_19515 [Ignelater luminosus]